MPLSVTRPPICGTLTSDLWLKHLSVASFHMDVSRLPIKTRFCEGRFLLTEREGGRERERPSDTEGDR